MFLYNLVVEHREALKIIFSLAIVLACFIIVLRTHRLFKLASHEGIRYFRNVFMFFGLAFLFRYFSSFSAYFLISYEFFLMSACFFLFYSLTWKRFRGENKTSSLFNFRIIIFYLMALIISLLDFFWGVYHFAFIAQIIIFGFAGGIIFERSNSSEKGRFLNLYFLVISLNLFARITNLAISLIWHWNTIGVIIIYLLDAAVFFLFLYGVIKATKE